MVVLPETSQSHASGIADKIREAVRNREIPHAANVSEILTVSIGVAARVPSLTDDPGTLIHEADAALYTAKAKGRDRVRVFTRADPPGGTAAAI